MGKRQFGVSTHLYHGQRLCREHLLEIAAHTYFGGNNDILVLNNGTVTGGFQGDASGTTGTDRLFIFGGSVGGEVQNGQGPTSINDFTFVYGGTVAETVEAQRGSVTPYIIIDGGTVEGLEVQNANATFGTAVA